jgi:ribosomal protein S18 acetylase RimI-like enzyme
MNDSLKTSFEEKSERDDRNFIADKIDGYNSSRVGYDDYKPLNYFLRDENNVIVGGLLAETLWEWLHIDILWLDEKYRNQGIGRELMLAAEQKAIERGCRFAFLDTWDFQAKEFYLKLGYEVFGELPNFPKSHSRYFMKKNLQ